MSLNAKKFSGPIKVGSVSADPSSPQNGELYYNTTSNVFRKYENGSWMNLSTSVSTFSDSAFRVQDNADATKQMAFEVSAITTGTTRTVTMPDSNVNLGLIATALQSVSQDTAPQLGGNLDLNSKDLLGTMKRAAVATPTKFVEQQYIHDTALVAATTAVIAALTFAFATYSSIQIDYAIRQDTSLITRQGTLRVATDGTIVSITDEFSETNDAEIAFTAAVNGANIEISYTNADGALDAHARLDVKRFLVTN